MNCTRKSGQWKFKLFNIKKEVQKMAKRQIQFTQEQIEILLKNPNVESISSNTIRFTSEFKELAMQKDKEGIPAMQIFKDAGVDLDILGKETPKTSIRNWRHREKTFNKQDQVNISSLEQLNNNDNNLYLWTIGFRSTDNGETLEDYCKKIQKRIYEECPSALSAFEDLLISYGYYSHCKYDNLKRLSQYKNSCYLVKEGFPIIPISIKNPAIISVNYKLDLSYCKDFLIDVKDLIKLIK